MSAGSPIGFDLDKAIGSAQRCSAVLNRKELVIPFILKRLRLKALFE
jgi:hypothetical protein